MHSFFSTKSLCLSAIVAALYCGLTLAFQAISFGALQFRVSEALTLLAALFPQAVPGLALGCLLSNLLGGANVYDIVFGTLATLAAAMLTWQL
ncbi:MAG: QueT transporter family protein, partial [Clostridia bacterium]